MTWRKDEDGLIDSPTPFDPLADWEAFAAEMEKFKDTHHGAAEALTEAREVIALKRKEAEERLRKERPVPLK